MNKEIKDIIDIQNTLHLKKEEVWQGDTIKWDIFLSSSSLVSNLKNSTLQVKIVKEDNSFILQSSGIIVEAEKLSIKIDKQATVIPGKVEMVLSIFENEEIITTCIKELLIKEDITKDKIKSENIVTIISEIQEKVLDGKKIILEIEEVIKRGDISTMKEDINSLQNDVVKNTNDIVFLNNTIYNQNSVIGEVDNKLRGISDLMLIERFGLTPNCEISKVLNEAIATAGIYYLRVPRGEYSLESDLILKEGLTLEFEEGTTITRSNPTITTMVRNAKTGSNFEKPFSAPGNIKIIGGKFIGNLAIGGSTNGIGLGKAENIILKNVCIDDVQGHHIDMSGCRNITFDGCEFSNYTDITADKSKGYIEAIQCAPMAKDAFPAFGTYDNQECYNIEVKNCIFKNIACGVGDHCFVEGHFANNISVHNCYFENITHTGIKFKVWNNIEVRNNRFHNCFRSLQCQIQLAENGISKKCYGNNFVSFCNNRVTCDENFIGGTYNVQFLGDGVSTSDYSKSENIVINNNIVNLGVENRFFESILGSRHTIVGNRIISKAPCIRLSQAFEASIITSNNCYGKSTDPSDYVIGLSRSENVLKTTLRNRRTVISNNTIVSVDCRGLTLSYSLQCNVNGGIIETYGSDSKGHPLIVYGNSSEGDGLKAIECSIRNLIVANYNEVVDAAIKVESSSQKVIVENCDCYGVVKNIKNNSVA